MNDQELAGRRVLVTGASKNIGRAIALDLAAGGAHVALVARQDRAGLDAVAGEIAQAGGTAVVLLADVSDEASVRRMVEDAAAQLGGLDVLVNNAAVRNEAHFEDLTFARWREVMAIALDGAFLCCQACLPHLAQGGEGAIINIGGLTAYTGARDRAHVVAAKAGLDGLTKALAHDLAPKGVTVNLVSPGLIDTVRGGPSSAAEPTHHKTHATLLGRRGKPSEVAAMVRLLAGPQGRFITGQTIHVNGGAYLP
ncbi:SDR family NAD(P)-dependent oxidoreductase [Alsobacter sp. KACC 23698]|uniref:SDR family NAD(P)-dependent oxidoreductase n=1 Tax=Alsobacter sp. KACC 23698 TaxID=3149229 RepID=A0AAU7JKI2_9HYPH